MADHDWEEKGGEPVQPTGPLSPFRNGNGTVHGMNRRN